MRTPLRPTRKVKPTRKVAAWYRGLADLLANALATKYLVAQKVKEQRVGTKKRNA